MGSPPEKISSEYENLCKSVREADHQYYTDPDNASLTDAEYDRMWLRLRDIEMDYPELASEDSPTQKPGGFPDESSFTSVRHGVPMLSLDKAYDDYDLSRFFSQFPKGQAVELTPKMDGASLSLEYKDGWLVHALSRGDGEVGEDITANALKVKGVQPRVSGKFTGIVRGEVLIQKKDFEEINESGQFANARNAAAGALRSKDPEDVVSRRLIFVAYDRYGADQETKLGFTYPVAMIVASLKEAQEAIQKLFLRRDELPYEIDGVVLKVVDRALRTRLGNTGHHPRWAIAFKTENESASTFLKHVEWQIGKSGIVAPVAALEPVKLMGTTIERASLHNMSVIKDKGIRMRQYVDITRAGAVIPYVIGPTADPPRVDLEIDIAPPSECPACDSLLEMSGSQILRCISPVCGARSLARLEQWASRQAADIDSVGPSLIAQLNAAGYLDKPSDFYSLTKQALLNLDRVGEKMAVKVLASIERSKGVGMRKALVGLSIPYCSEGTAKRLCRHYSSIEEVASASIGELENIDDIGFETAKSIHWFFMDQTNDNEVLRLRASGVVLDRLPEDAPKAASGPLSGLSVCVTGRTSRPRTELHRLLEHAGAKIASGVTSKTDILVAGEKAGSKLNKAEKLGIRVLSESELRGMIDA